MEWWLLLAFCRKGLKRRESIGQIGKSGRRIKGEKKTLRYNENLVILCEPAHGFRRKTDGPNVVVCQQQSIVAVNRIRILQHES